MTLPILLIVIVGLLSGSIVNALADDLPHYRRPKLPHYPDGTPRPMTAWLGLLAFALGQRAAATGSKLTWRYPLTEVVTVFLMIITYIIKRGEPEADTLQIAFWLAYIPIFVLITVIDVEHKLILFVVIIPSAIIAILDALTTKALPSIQGALLGGALGFGTFFVLYLGGIVYVYVANQVQGRNINEVAFGYGDVMMATLSGLILGMGDMIFAMFLTVIFGAMGALLYLIGKRLSGTGYSLITALPYGPYIVLGTIIMLLFSQQVRILLVGYA
jgi:leader peptidase (prepilin peptidase) / N-methyltransferase